MNEPMQRFFAKVQQDEALRTKLAGSGSESREDAMRWAVQVAADAGYDFTAADLGSAIETITGEMTPEQLDQVAGGGTLVGNPGKALLDRVISVVGDPGQTYGRDIE